jgi:hypothetical protein
MQKVGKIFARTAAHRDIRGDFGHGGRNVMIEQRRSPVRRRMSSARYD